MAKRIKPLTATEIKEAKPREKEYKLFDGGGLYLAVAPKGGKWWRLKYRLNGKERRISLGTYPTTSLQDARRKREELKSLIAQGIDPAERRKREKQQAKAEEAKRENTFCNVSQMWLEGYQNEVAENHYRKQVGRLRNHVYPYIGERPMEEITRKEIIAILDRMKAKGIDETARRVADILNKIYKYAVTYEFTPHNIIADIDRPAVLGRRKERHYPTLTKPSEIRALLQAIDEYKGDRSTRMALKLLPYVPVRIHNLRYMEWQEIDFEAREWAIPAEKMKAKRPFVLPLSHQAIAILQEAKENALSPLYVFPSPIYKDRPLSENTHNTALRRMGYSKDELVVHSFRSMFSTIANEYVNSEDGHGYTGEVIEACLAHKETNKVRAAYNRANYKEAMRSLLQWWADWLDAVKHG